MTAIIQGDNERCRPGFSRQKRHHPGVDMTPMVDLGFILITFFVMTVQLTTPATVHLAMPKEGGEPAPLRESDALTILLDDNNRIFYYHGNWNDARQKNQVYVSGFSVTDGIGKVIREKQQWLDKNGKEGRKGLMLLIKPGQKASYKNVVDALDEALINGVKKYALLTPDSDETAWMDNRGRSPGIE